MKKQFEDKNHAAAFDRYIDAMTKLIMKYGARVLKQIRENESFAASSLKWLRRKEMQTRLELYWRKRNKRKKQK